MSLITEPPQCDRSARLRFAIIGPLLAASRAPRLLRQALRVLAAKTCRHPVSGLDVHFGVSTIERWYYAARHKPDPVAALRNRLRREIGRFPRLQPMQNQIQFQALQGNHDTEGNTCGVDALDRWLKRIARQHISKGVSRTFVAIDPTNHAQILGYCSLTMAEIEPTSCRKTSPRNYRGACHWY